MSRWRASSPRKRAIALAAETEKDPRFVEVVLGESRRVVRHRPGLLIVEHRLGFVMANAGIDHSNVAPGDGVERVLLLPLDPDASAARLREQLVERLRQAIGVIISDSFGRPWRTRHGRHRARRRRLAGGDRHARPARPVRPRVAEVTETGFADEIAAAASLVHGPGRRGDADGAGARPLLVGAGSAGRRAGPPAEHDLFR